jgi:glycolate oxidase FAD binding subunit
VTATDTILIDGFGPTPVVRAGGAADVGALVRAACAQRQAVYPVGGRTMLEYGMPPARPGVALDVSALNAVVDYPARDMTITVGAGIPMARLFETLGRENQCLPVDVPSAEQATLGGAIATNMSGPRRFGFGTLRDYVIGIKIINDKGEEVKAGGRVVKNVAGYDLCKLHVGALGTLGVVTEVTLKLRPLAEENAVVALPCPGDRLAGLLDDLHRSRTRPVCLDLLSSAAVRYINERLGAALPDGAWVAIIGYQGNREVVGWQVQQVIRELSAERCRGLQARVATAAAPVWRGLVEFMTAADRHMMIKANVLPSGTAELCTRLERFGEDIRIQAHAGNGIVRGQLPAHLSLERSRELVQDVAALATAKQGNVIITSCPTGWKAELPVWGRPRPDAGLMAKVKSALDPADVFNSGRLLPALSPRMPGDSAL